MGTLLIFFVLYFIPTIVCVFRKKRDVWAIFILNLVAGWTFVGWVVALVWGLTEDK
jgi:hypothetical protein